MECIMRLGVPRTGKDAISHDVDRYLRLALRRLAGRVLSREVAVPDVGRSLLVAVRHGGAEPQLRAASGRRRVPCLARLGTRRLRVHREGEPLPDALPPAAGTR